MTSIIKVDQIQNAAGGTPTAADLGLNVSGSVLQTVYARYASEVTISSAGWVSTGLSATITPKFASSTILVTVFQQVNLVTSGGTESGCGFMVIRDGTNVSNSASATSFDLYHYDATTNNNFRGRIPYAGTDSPASTSLLTYTAYVTKYSPDIKAQDNNNPSFMILQEIAQ